MIKEAYVSLEAAKLLKKKGFPIDICQKWYNEPNNTPFTIGFNGCLPCPTQQMAIRWLRETHNIYIMIDKDFATTDGWHYYIATKKDWESSESKHIQQESNHYTYEEAAESAIKYCLENLI